MTIQLASTRFLEGKGRKALLSRPSPIGRERNINALLDHVVGRAMMLAPRKKSREWSPEEDAFLEQHLGFLTDAEIGEQLGRSEIGVHLRWSRDLHLPSPSKHPDVITALQAADMLGIDGHKTAHWVDVGLIPGRLMAGDRKIRLIRRVSFMRWACAPVNWVYFDIKQVRDPKLKRLLKLEAKRWGDEWWNTRAVADYHGVDTTDVKRYIKLGRLHSFRIPVSLGGRHGNRKWSNHFVLKSEAMKVHFYRLGEPGPSIFTPAADAWLLRARDKLDMTFVHIGKTMKIGTVHQRTSNYMISTRYRYLKILTRGKRRKK